MTEASENRARQQVTVDGSDETAAIKPLNRQQEARTSTDENRRDHLRRSATISERGHAETSKLR
ncbi:hypothetical protein Dimus_007013, partial [Dionaea muscipula]